MADNHVRFENLCTFAAIGQLTEPELSEFLSHREQCEVCRERVRGMEEAAEEVFMAYALTESSRRFPKGMFARFIARANREGIPLHPRKALFGLYTTPLLSVLTVLMLAVCVSSIWRGGLSSGSLRARVDPVSSIHADKRDGESSQSERPIFRTEGATDARPFGRRVSVRRERKVRGSGSHAALLWQEDHEKLQAPRIDFVMYSPKPRFSNYYTPHSLWDRKFGT